MPIPIQDLFEAHLHVSNLERSLAFYTGVLGLPLASAFPDRRVAFVWATRPGEAMLGLWDVGTVPQRLALHVAFRVDIKDLLNAATGLQNAGIEPLDFSGEPTDQPVVLAWMPAASIYFRDPDGNLLEFIAPMPGPPRPELGIINWSAWRAHAGSDSGFESSRSNRDAFLAGDAASTVPVTIRPAVSDDADGIAHIFLESAEYHASLDPERYSSPGVETISARYREGRQHPEEMPGMTLTLVAENRHETVGFIDARLEQSPDPMHREITYCHIAEFAVRSRYQKQGIGGRLLRAAEEWGRSKGAQFASLEYHTANTRASSFYQQRMDYRPASIIGIKRLS